MTYQALPSFLHIEDSPVAGQGIFATQNIPSDVKLGVSHVVVDNDCLLYTSPSPRDLSTSRMPSSA